MADISDFCDNPAGGTWTNNNNAWDGSLTTSASTSTKNAATWGNVGATSAFSNIPAGSIINGIMVTVNCVGDGDDFIDVHVYKQSKGNYSTNSIRITPTTSQGDRTAGNSTELWGEASWSLDDDIKQSTFGVRLTYDATGKANALYVWRVSLTVYYTEPLPKSISLFEGIGARERRITVPGWISMFDGPAPVKSSKCDYLIIAIPRGYINSVGTALYRCVVVSADLMRIYKSTNGWGFVPHCDVPLPTSMVELREYSFTMDDGDYWYIVYPDGSDTHKILISDDAEGTTFSAYSYDSGYDHIEHYDTVGLPSSIAYVYGGILNGNLITRIVEVDRNGNTTDFDIITDDDAVNANLVRDPKRNRIHFVGDTGEGFRHGYCSTADLDVWYHLDGTQINDKSVESGEWTSAPEFNGVFDNDWQTLVEDNGNLADGTPCVIIRKSVGKVRDAYFFEIYEKETKAVYFGGQAVVDNTPFSIVSANTAGMKKQFAAEFDGEEYSSDSLRNWGQTKDGVSGGTNSFISFQERATCKGGNAFDDKFFIFEASTGKTAGTQCEGVYVQMVENFTYDPDKSASGYDALGVEDSESVSTVAVLVKTLFDAIKAVDEESLSLITHQFCSLSDSVGLVDALTRQAVYKKALVDAVALSDVSLKDFLKVISDAVELSDSVAKSFYFVRMLGDAISIEDSASKVFFRVMADALGGRDDTVRKMVYSRAFADAIGALDSYGRVSSFVRSFSDALSLTDDVYAITVLLKHLVEEFGISDDMSRRGVFIRAVADALAMEDVASKDVVKTLFDSIDLAELLSSESEYLKAFADALGVKDEYERVASYIRGLDDSIALADEYDRVAEFVREVYDGLGVKDDVLSYTILPILIAIADAIGVKDDPSRTADYLRAFIEDAGLSDEKAHDMLKVVVDQIAVEDMPFVTAKLIVALSDLLGIRDDSVLVYHATRYLTDALMLRGDVDLTKIVITKILVDSLSIHDSVSREAILRKLLGEVVRVEDDFVRTGVFFRGFVDALSLTDDVTSKIFILFLALSDRVGVGELYSRRGEFVRRLSDMLSLRDAPAIITGIVPYIYSKETGPLETYCEEQFVVILTDSSGNRVSGANVRLDVTRPDGSYWVQDSIMVENPLVSGEYYYSFGVITGVVPGRYVATVTASKGSVPKVESFSLLLRSGRLTIEYY